ncbi:MAG: hypothetical protein U1E32_11945 [Rhodoglobus sp.]|nr:hypothetical protein [Rhodoglobus sp.]
MTPEAPLTAPVGGVRRLSTESGGAIALTPLHDGSVELSPPSGSTMVIELVGQLSFALFESGVSHSSPTDPGTREIHDALQRFYAVTRRAGCVALDFGSSRPVSTTIQHHDDSVTLTVRFPNGAPPVVHLHGTSEAHPGFVAATTYGDAIDEATHRIALWANQVGTLGSLDIPGSVYPTLRLPEREYWTLNTFFDPDTWSVLNCLSFSGDDYLVTEARSVLERVRSFVREDGRVPHHFDGAEPEYVAISGASQPGPNIFYLLAVLDHVAATGDTDYLRSVWSGTLVPCLESVLDTLDPEHDLLVSGGPLWIDVFRREGHTFDTNAMTVHLLRRMAGAATHLGEASTAARWSAVAGRIANALDRFWQDDHYATVLPGIGSDLDMVDSDDVLAVLAGVADDDRARIIFDRLDDGMHPGGRGTWVSGVPYPEELCYEGNTGDSACAFARIWWAELRSRRDRGDAEGFTRLFEAVRGDLLAHTWMGERYDSTGAMSRADGYHEYPGVLDILLREGSYGLVVDVGGADIRPMRSGDFRFETGGLRLERTSADWRVTIPGSGPRSFTFHDLEPGATYHWNGTTVVAPPDGVLRLSGQAGVEQRLDAQFSGVLAPVRGDVST